MKLVIAILFLLFYIPLNSIIGQERLIRGKVVDAKGEAVAGANVMLLGKVGGRIVSFSLTQQSGEYELQTANVTDSFLLKVSHLNYDEQVLLVSPEVDFFHLTLVNRSYDLPAMTVKQKAVIRRGDTLSFDVNQLREASDENVEQLLNRIPGIEIEANGQIRYQGLVISKFYIEGLDLLEGRYGQATRSLRPGVVRDVEIIEHHQPILALDSLERPPNAAINLRLKSDIALTGNLRAGVGGFPLLYLLEPTVFGFGKKQQFNLLGSANNTGDYIGANFEDLYKMPSIARPLVSPTLPLSPLNVKPIYYRDNRELSGGFNLLRKLGGATQFKWSSFVTSDRQLVGGRQETTFGDGLVSETLVEDLSVIDLPLRLNSRLVYEVNRKRLYLKNSLTGEYSWQKTVGDNFFNGSANSELFNHRNVKVDGLVTGIVRKDKRADRYEGNFSYRDEDYSLEVVPLLVFVPDTAAFSLERATQIARRSMLKAKIYTNRYYRSGKMRGQLRVGARAERQRINSNLSEGADMNSLNDLFVNDNLQDLIVTSLSPVLEHVNTTHRLALELPLALHYFRFKDFLNGDVSNNFPVVIQPGITYSYFFSRRKSLSFDYAFSLDYARDQPLFTGYLLQQNRYFLRSLPSLNRSQEHSLSGSFSGENQARSFVYRISLAAERRRAELLVQTVFNNNGQGTEQVQGVNLTKMLRGESQADFSLTKQFKLKTSATYVLTAFPILVNGASLSVSQHRMALFAKFTQVFSTTVLAARTEAVFLRTSLTSQPLAQLNLKLTCYQEMPSGWGSWRIAYDVFQTSGGNRRIVNNQLLNVRYQRPVMKNKFEISLAVNNLTGAKRFVAIDQQQSISQLSFYNLRGRQILFTLSKRI